MSLSSENLRVDSHDEREWIQVVHNVVWNTVQLHGSCLRNQVGRHLDNCISREYRVHAYHDIPVHMATKRLAAKGTLDRL